MTNFIDHEDVVEKSGGSEFVHSLLDWKLSERLEDALTWINRLSPDDVLVKRR